MPSSSLTSLIQNKLPFVPPHFDYETNRLIKHCLKDEKKIQTQLAFDVDALSTVICYLKYEGKDCDGYVWNSMQPSEYFISQRKILADLHIIDSPPLNTGNLVTYLEKYKKN